VKRFVPFRDAPIRHKLMLIGLLTTALALFSVSLILVARDWVDGREKTLAAMENYAVLIGANAAPSVIFGDYDAANEVLQTLGENSDIVDAVLYDRDGKVFARYRAPMHLDDGIPLIDPGSYLFTLDRLVVTKPVMLKGEVWGSVYLESDLHGLYADIRHQVLLTFAAAAGVFLVALLLFYRLQRAIVAPVTTLSGVMRQVSAKRDYAVRVPVHGKDEVGALAGAFNDMLAQIQARDEALALHSEHLEQVVAQRTAELRENNRLLEYELVERKHAEETMARLRHELAMVLESAGEGICTMDTDGYHVMVNPSAARMFGYEAKEMIGRDSHVLWHYAKADGSPYPGEECPINATMRDGVVRRSEGEVFWRKGGISFPVEYVSTPIRSSGAITGAVVVFRDITERKRAEAERRRLSEALEQSMEAIVLTDIGRSIIYVNPAFTRLFGYSTQEVVGQSVDLLAVEGRLVQIAFVRSPKAEIDVSVLMRKRAWITGSTLRPRTPAEKGDIARALRAEVWPLLEAGTVYVTSMAKRVYALDAATGQPQWSQPFEADGAMPSTPALAGDKLYVGALDNRLYALDIATGEPAW